MVGEESNDVPPSTGAMGQLLPNWFLETFLKLLEKLRPSNSHLAAGKHIPST